MEFYFETDWTSVLLMFWSLGSHCVFLPVENCVTALTFYAAGSRSSVLLISVYFVSASPELLATMQLLSHSDQLNASVL